MSKFSTGREGRGISPTISARSPTRGPCNRFTLNTEWFQDHKGLDLADIIQCCPQMQYLLLVKGTTPTSCSLNPTYKPLSITSMVEISNKTFPKLENIFSSGCESCCVEYGSGLLTEEHLLKRRQYHQWEMIKLCQKINDRVIPAPITGH